MDPGPQRLSALPRSDSGTSPSGGPSTSAFASRPIGNSHALKLLVFPGPRVDRGAFAFLKNEVTDPHSRHQLDLVPAGVEDLQDLPVRDPRGQERGRDVAHEADAGEPRARVQPPAKIPREGDLLLRDSQNQLARFEEIAVGDVPYLGQGPVVDVRAGDVLVGIEDAQP